MKNAHKAKYVYIPFRHFNSDRICQIAYSPVNSNDSVSGQWRSRSDCADAKADLDFRCPHMPENMFSRGARPKLM